jgi:CubicO group peptidase (beta-lactamase class C family)
MKYRLFFAVLALGIAILPVQKGSAQDFPYQVFERYLEPLAQQIGMPGLSALILRNGTIEWERGYGFSDVENRTLATIHTPYPVGGVTQAVTGVLFGICVDRYRFSIDELMGSHTPTFSDPGATVRHVLAHASTGRYEYDPVKFAGLTPVLEQCIRLPFRVATAVEVLDQLDMTESVPGLDLNRPEGALARELFTEAAVRHYDSVLRQAAVPYRIDRRTGRHTRSEYPTYGLDAAAGLVASAYDLSTFERKLDDDDNVPLDRNTLRQMWTNTVLDDPVNPNLKTPMPTGLGWFVQKSSGIDLVWTFGHIPDAGSALIVKMPSKSLTLILLANSDGLTAGYNLERGDITTSPFVKIFLRLFI